MCILELMKFWQCSINILIIASIIMVIMMMMKKMNISWEIYPCAWWSVCLCTWEGMIDSCIYGGAKRLIQNEHKSQWSEVSPDKKFSPTADSDQFFRILVMSLNLAIPIPQKLNISLSVLRLKSGLYYHHCFSAACGKILMDKILH